MKPLKHWFFISKYNTIFTRTRPERCSFRFGSVSKIYPAWWGHIQPVVRPIKVSHTACKQRACSDEILDLTVSWCFLFYKYIARVSGTYELLLSLCMVAHQTTHAGVCLTTAETKNGDSVNVRTTTTTTVPKASDEYRLSRFTEGGSRRQHDGKQYVSERLRFQPLQENRRIPPRRQKCRSQNTKHRVQSVVHRLKTIFQFHKLSNYK